jgi:hypothetical protein
VRREVGWSQTRELLLADATAPRATGIWRVAGAISEIQPDRLRRLETWLWREDSHDGPRLAVNGQSSHYSSKFRERFA